MTFTEKFLRARPAIEVAGRSVKRYHVTPGPDGVEPEIERAAFAILPRLLPERDETPPATFIVVHRSRGDNAAYLNAYSWVWDNVLHLRGRGRGPARAGLSRRRPDALHGDRGPSLDRLRVGAAARSPTSATPGSGTCCCRTSPTSTRIWPISCRTA